jgi:hypothetical protein
MRNPFDEPVSPRRRLLTAFLVIGVVACATPFLYAWISFGLAPQRFITEIQRERAQRQHVPLGRVVSSAVALIGHQPGKSDGSPSIAASSQRYPEMVEALRHSSGFRSIPPRTVPDLMIVIQPDTSVAMGTLRRYDYVSATGELGHGEEWCRVPEEFRLWILSMKKDHSIKPVGNPSS